jgi:uncharacterized protein (DUF2235 family)
MTKRLIVCCDGTWNVPDHFVGKKNCPTNVVKIAEWAADRDPKGMEQRIFYESGVGTAPGIRDTLLGGAFGLGLSAKILAAYGFVVEEYDPGDELFFFGFSRGAYTARSTVGLIRNSGILRRTYRDKIPDAYALYRSRDKSAHPRAREAELFRRTYSCEPVTPITFIGVWDTVGSYGIPSVPLLPEWLTNRLNRRWAFHDVTLSSTVANAFHAVAIDERRLQFKPTLWDHKSTAHGQHMEQVWFTGVHTDVGGGRDDTGLSDIALGWIKAKAEACGMAFKDEKSLRVPPVPNPCGPAGAKTLFYRVLGGDWIRPMGNGQSKNEAVHPSAVFRQHSCALSYAPTNLAAFQLRCGKVARGAPGWVAPTEAAVSR